MTSMSPTVTIVGVPFDEHSSFLRGTAGAPAKIREALHSASANLCAESGRDLGGEDRFTDAGDLAVPSGAAAFAAIEQGIGELLDGGDRLVVLGGDHAVTYPIVRAFARRHKALTILHLDAHPDLYDELGGDRLSHACPFARIMEEGLVARLVQMGIRTMTPLQRVQAERFGVEVITVDRWAAEVGAGLTGPLYLSLDLDVLDPAFAPGLSHHEPGGVSTRDVLEVIQRIAAPLVGADIVEYNPVRDLNGVTAMVAAKCVKEIVDRMLPPGRA